MKNCFHCCSDYVLFKSCTGIRGRETQKERTAIIQIFSNILHEQLLSFTFLVAACFRELKTACGDALAGKKKVVASPDDGGDKTDKSLATNFELLNLVPERATKGFDGSSNRSAAGTCASSQPITKLAKTLMERNAELEATRTLEPLRAEN